MKVRKLVKYLDFCSDIEIIDKDDSILWNGSTVYLQCAADVRGDREQALAEARADQDFDFIDKVTSAMISGVLDRKLSEEDDYDAIGAIPSSKEGFVKFQIYVQ